MSFNLKTFRMFEYQKVSAIIIIIFITIFVIDQCNIPSWNVLLDGKIYIGKYFLIFSVQIKPEYQKNL